MVRPRVGVDFTVVAGKYQGSRSYLLGIYAEIVQILPNVDFYFYHPRPGELKNWPGNRYDNVKLVRFPNHYGAAVRLLWSLPRAIRRDRIEIIHTQYVAPLSRRAKRVVTIHDILFEDFPKFFPRFFRWRSKFLFRISARVADLVLTVSQYSADAIIRTYDVDASKVIITPNSVDLTRFGNGRLEGSDRARLGLPLGDYMLSVGRLEARKNIGNLIRAYNSMPSPAPPLVIVGKVDTEFVDAGLPEFNSSPGTEIYFISEVSDLDLAKIYQGAILFIFPSLAEGFGMPILEAMACGVPVIASNATAMPEVVRSAGILVDMQVHGVLVEAMATLLIHPEERDRLRTLGFERVRESSWHSSASAFVEGMTRKGLLDAK